MRRLRLFATFVLVLAIVPAVGQHGASHSSFAGHGGFGQATHISQGGMRGRANIPNPTFRSSGRSRLGSRNLGPRSSGFGRHGVGRGAFLRNHRFHRDRFHRFDPDRDDDDDDFRFRFDFRNCFGFNCGGWAWGWPWWWSWDPWWSESHSSYDNDQERDLALANEMNQQSLAEQRQRRKEEQHSDEGSDPQPQTRKDAPADPPAVLTVLIFRDQHRQEIQNYTIMGTTLWAFAPQRTQKISLADLDIQATTKANDDRGLDFRVPGAEVK